jgi:hypothetical protein
MNTVTFISSIMFIIPAAYIAHKFYHLGKGVNLYSEQVKNLNGEDSVKVESAAPLQSNLTLIHCQKCNHEESNLEFPQVATRQ